jgi:hypothetical protein
MLRRKNPCEGSDTFMAAKFGLPPQTHLAPLARGYSVMISYTKESERERKAIFCYEKVMKTLA